MRKFHILLLIMLFISLFSLTADVADRSEKLTKSNKTVLEDKLSKQAIEKLVEKVNRDRLKKTIYELQENKDLDQPHIPFRSRFCLRVKNTDNPSDYACDNAAKYIFNKFKSYGLKVGYDVFEHRIQQESSHFASGIKGNYEMRNVVATLPGKGPNKNRVYIICAHYDSTADLSEGWQEKWKSMPAPGATDNAAGVAAVLEIARILSEEDFDYSLKFIAFTGEEMKFLGSQHYIEMAINSNEEIMTCPPDIDPADEL